MINWKILKVKKEESKIKLRKYAKQDAGQCIPKDSNLTDTENEIMSKAMAHFNEIRQIGLKFFSKLEPEINKLHQSIQNAKDKLYEFYEHVVGNIEEAISIASAKINRQKTLYTY